MTTITIHDRAQAIIDGLELYKQLVEAVVGVTDLVRRMDDSNAEAYIVAPLRIATSNDHGYVTRDDNFQNWLSRQVRDFKELTGNLEDKTGFKDLVDELELALTEIEGWSE